MTPMELTGRDGLPCQVWQNPTNYNFGMRGLLTQSDIYVWQSDHLSHADFERATGIEGLQITLRAGQVHANNETVALPEHFPWVFPDRGQAEAMDVEDRRKMVTEHLGNRLRHVYPTGFIVHWYS
jgi:hypothetical protein